MDTDYRAVCTEFELALSVLGTVISRTKNERLVLDVAPSTGPGKNSTASPSEAQ